MSELLVEVHVPLTADDDGEELGEEYLFFVSGGTEADLLSLARQIANLPGVPIGTYATVTDTEADMGLGQRVELD